FVWDTPAIAKAARLWKADKSASEIAEAMGPGVTRNAVIGMIRRNGLTRSAEEVARAKARDLKKRAQNLARPHHPSPKPADLPPPPAPPPPAPRVKKVDTAVAREPLRLTLMELEVRSCRWIVTTGAPWLYCGHNVKGATNLDTPYCAAHTQVAHPQTQTSLHRATRERNVLRSIERPA
ncbi:MAG: GcrA family cell cycle regulator, partial [Brevundimonas sp.]